MVHFFQEGPEFCGDPLFCKMFPDTKIAKKYGSHPEPEILVAQDKWILCLG